MNRPPSGALDVVADADREQGEDADGGEDQLRVLPGEVRDPVQGGADCTRISSKYFETQINLIESRYERGEYGQACSVAGALDRIGERWSLLIVRGCARTAALLRPRPRRRRRPDRRPHQTPPRPRGRRHRARRELAPPASAVAYELTELGRELERPLLELGRWGMELLEAEDVAGLKPSWLPNSFRVILRPPAAAEMTIQLRSEGRAFGIRVSGGRVSAERGETDDPDLIVSGPPRGIVAALVVGREHAEGVEVEGDGALFEALREMVVLPERLREDARTTVGPATARTA